MGWRDSVPRRGLAGGRRDGPAGAGVAAPALVVSVGSLAAARGGVSGGAVLCLLVGLAAVTYVIIALLRQRAPRRGGPGGRAQPPVAPGPPDPHPGVPTADLAAQANTLLIGSDDALKTSAQELSFATAQYGSPATAEFAVALAEARIEVAQAFHLRQLLDDEVPENEPTRRVMLNEIIVRCTAANRTLDEQASAFDALRDLEGRVAGMLVDVTEHRDAVAARLPAAVATLATLREKWAAAALSTVVGNVDQARDRLAFAADELLEAGAALAQDDRSAAAIAVRGAEEAVGQAGTLLDAIEASATDLAAARAAIDGALAELAGSLAAGRAAAGAADATHAMSLHAAVGKAEEVSATVRGQLTATGLDPLTALRRLETAGAELDQALAGVRDNAARADRARILLDQSLLAARARINAVSDFITTRRAAVGTRARTRLAEAQRYLDQAMALQGSDPATALQHAQHADALAEQAGQAADADVSGWSDPHGMMPGGRGGNADAMGGIGGVVLGGILLESMLGRGRRFTGDPAAWGGRVPGSYGGMATRARYGRRR